MGDRGALCDAGLFMIWSLSIALVASAPEYYPKPVVSLSITHNAAGFHFPEIVPHL